MKQFIKKAAVPVLAAVMVMSATVGTASSYFTTYVTAQGGHPLNMRDVHVIPHEEVDSNVKNITVQNDGAEECYARAKAVVSGTIPVAYAPGEGWFDGGDGYWYYSRILQPGESSSVIKATITLPTSSETNPIPEGTTVNVVVVAECAKVLYENGAVVGENGPGYVGWSLTAKEG